MLVLTGHGYGHGMGMGQWGAYGYALHGWTAPQIIAHYYSGTTLADDPAPNVRVLLAAGRSQVSLDSASRWRVVDARGKKLHLPAGPLVVAATLRVRGHALVSPLTFTAGATPLEVGGRPYHGKVVVVSNGRTLQIVNTVAMSDYLDGVVGSEMPSTWPAAALEAQAIAARSYALAAIDDDVTASPFDLYSDTRSQVYGGIKAESPPVIEAVQATGGEVVLYDGQVATTYYSASTGGQTVSAEEVTGKAVPYLSSVADPYDTYSPYHDWGPILFTAAEAGKKLGLPGPLVALETVPGPSYHVMSATAVGATTQVTLSGPQVEADLGLRSTWFDAGWLSLTPPSAPVTSGSQLSLTGIARGLTGVTLEAQAAGGAWQQVADVAPAADGSFSTTVSPQWTTSYRLAWGTVRTATVTVEVAATVSATPVVGGVYGSVSPAAAGESVSLERESGGIWTTVARGQTTAGGRFVLHARLAGGGVYRVGCGPAQGFLAGTSSLLTVAPGPERGRAP